MNRGSFQHYGDLMSYMRTYHDNSVCFGYKTKGEWHTISTRGFLDLVKYLSLGLKAFGVEKGDKIAIFSDSSPWWLMFDIALGLLEAVSVPLYANISEEGFLFAVRLVDVKLIALDGELPWSLVNRHPEFYDLLIGLNPDETRQVPMDFTRLVELGKKYDAEHPGAYDALEKGCHAKSLATIIFTSGTTGIAKGAMLTQESVLCCGHIDVFDFDETTDIFLNVLPLAHIFARNVDYLVLAHGVPIYFVDDIKNIAAVCDEVKPTTAIVVPRLVEKIYSKILAQVQKSSPFKRFLGMWAIRYALKPKKNAFLLALADKLVYRKLRNRLGGRIRGLLSGGAPLNTQLFTFFNTIGIPLITGWGLTEGGCLTANNFHRWKTGTIGRSLGVADIKISDKGEILVKGPSVMLGYYKNEEETKAALTEDGWLHTGDLGSIDDEGFVTISGRIKELFKTTTGNYIAPIPIEMELTKTPLIDMAMVIGDNRKYATCLLFPDFDVINSIRHKTEFREMSEEEFLHSDYVKERVERAIENTNEHLNKWEKIVSYRIIPVHLSVEGGELTPTMKIRRKIVEEKYRQIVESMYFEEKK